MGAAPADLYRPFADATASRLNVITTRCYEVNLTLGGKTISREIVQRPNGFISCLQALTSAITNRRIAGPADMARIAAAIAANDTVAAAGAVSDRLRDAAGVARALLQEAP